MASKCEDGDCKVVTEISHSLEILGVEFKGYAKSAKEHFAHDKEKLTEYGLQIKECVADLKEGTGHIFSFQAAIKTQNERLKMGDHRFNSHRDDIKEIKKDIKEHIRGKNGEHSRSNRKLNILLSLVGVYFVFLLVTHFDEFTSFMGKVWKIIPLIG